MWVGGSGPIPLMFYFESLYHLLDTLSIDMIQKQTKYPRKYTSVLRSLTEI